MTNNWSCYKPKNENINILNKLWSNTDKCDFYKYLYTNATIWLQRKRDIFDDYIINNEINEYKYTYSDDDFPIIEIEELNDDGSLISVITPIR